MCVYRLIGGLLGVGRRSVEEGGLHFSFSFLFCSSVVVMREAEED